MEQILTKKRDEINEKKYQLRKLVGDKYRDLTESADNIVSMRDSSITLLNSLRSIKTNCQLLLKKRTKQTQETQEKESKVDSLMKFADKVKMLIDIPESIWNTLQSGDLIEATHLYKQANIIYSELNQDKIEVSSIPLVSRQWKWILTFPDTIKKHCTAKLVSSGVSTLDLCAAISSYMIIENINEEKALDYFLKCRKECLSGCLTLQSEELNKLIQFVIEFKLSLLHCYWIFFYECKNEGKFTHKHISAEIMQWIQSCAQQLEVITSDIISKLTLSAQQIYNVYVSLFKTISDDTIFSQSETPTIQYFSQLSSLSQREKKHTTEKKQLVWEDLYNLLLSQNINAKVLDNDYNMESSSFIWNTFLEKVFFARASTIIKNSFVSLSWLNFSSMRAQQSPENQVSSSIWEFSSQDSGYSSKLDLKRGVIEQHSSKISPNVLPLLNSFEEFLDSVMDDFTSIGLFFSRKGERKTRKNFPFTESKIDDLQKIVENSFFSIMQALVKDLEEYCEDNKENINEVIYVGRFANAISFHSIGLKSILSNSSLNTKKSMDMNVNLSEITMKLLYRVSNVGDNANPLFSQLKSNLQSLNLRCSVKWVHWLTADLLAKSNFKQEIQTQEIFTDKMFGKVTLHEQEDVLYLPVFPSSPLSSLLSSYCEKVERFGCYLIEKQVLQYLSFHFSQKLLEIYNQYHTQQSSLSRECVLQHIFDLKLILDIFSGRAVVSEEIEQAIKETQDTNDPTNYFEKINNKTSNTNTNAPNFLPGVLLHKYNWKKNVETVLEKANSKIDPIDVAYYQPHIFDSVNNFLRKSYLLYSPLTNLYYTEEKILIKSSTEDPLHCLPISSAKSKFSTLPIGSSQDYKKETNKSLFSGNQHVVENSNVNNNNFNSNNTKDTKNRPHEEKKELSKTMSFLSQLNLFNRQK